jgi:hypothetical protein
MPGVYGSAAPVAMQPGDRALVLGLRNIPGFQGSVIPGGNAASSEDSGGDYAQSLMASQASGPVVIAAIGGRHPATQRQLIWEVSAKGTVGLNLQVATIDQDSHYVTIDTYSGTGNSGPRAITADINSTGDGGPGALATLKILSSARFIRVQDTGSGSTAIVAVTAL